MLKEMGEWASRYKIVAAMGYVAFLLAVGKVIHNLGKVAKVRIVLVVMVMISDGRSCVVVIVVVIVVVV